MTGAVSALNARSSSTSTPRSSPRSPRARSRPAASPSPRPSALVSSEVRAGALVTPTYPSPRRTRAHHRESRASVAVHAAAAASDDMDDGAPIKTTERLTPDAKRVVLLCAVTMLLASADRTIFSLGSLAIARDLSLSMSTVGLLQSRVLLGLRRDAGAGRRRRGQVRGSQGAAHGPRSVVRGRRDDPSRDAHARPDRRHRRRARALRRGVRVHDAGVRGGGRIVRTRGTTELEPQPHLHVFQLRQRVRVALSGEHDSDDRVAGGVPRRSGRSASRGRRSGSPRSHSRRGKERRSGRNEARGAGGAGPGWLSLPGWMYPQLGALAWCHVCINWGFFILQSWLPVYLAKELGFSLGGSGLVAALPWFLTAACSFSSGQIADFLVAKGWTRWKVRRLMMNIATIGPATALLLITRGQVPDGRGLFVGADAGHASGEHSGVSLVPAGRAAFQGWVVPGDNQHVGGHRRDSGELIRRVRRGDDGGVRVGLLGNRGRVRLERRGVEPQRERKGDVRVTRLFIIFRTVILFHDTVSSRRQHISLNSFVHRVRRLVQSPVVTNRLLPSARRGGESLPNRRRRPYYFHRQPPPFPRRAQVHSVRGVQLSPS